jgi:hypothetical protein
MGQPFYKQDLKERLVPKRQPIRPIRIEGSLAYVPLTRGYEAVIEASDVDLIEGVNWGALVLPHTVYATRTDRSTGVAKFVYLHRVLMGNPKGVQIDHIDRNGLNNLRSNLRVATQSINNYNQKRGLRNTSGAVGVDWRADKNKWRVRVSTKFIGHFDTFDEALASRKSALKQILDQEISILSDTLAT